jgi:hypothetical protein
LDRLKKPNRDPLFSGFGDGCVLDGRSESLANSGVMPLSAGEAEGLLGLGDGFLEDDFLENPKRDFGSSAGVLDFPGSASRVRDRWRVCITAGRLLILLWTTGDVSRRLISGVPSRLGLEGRGMEASVPLSGAASVRWANSGAIWGLLLAVIGLVSLVGEPFFLPRDAGRDGFFWGEETCDLGDIVWLRATSAARTVDAEDDDSCRTGVLPELLSRLATLSLVIFLAFCGRVLTGLIWRDGANGVREPAATLGE